MQFGNVPVVPTSIITKEGVKKVLPAVIKSYQRWNKRISTGLLNRWLEAIQRVHVPPPGPRNRTIKLKYMTQVRIVVVVVVVIGRGGRGGGGGGGEIVVVLQVCKRWVCCTILIAFTHCNTTPTTPTPPPPPPPPPPTTTTTTTTTTTPSLLSSHHCQLLSTYLQ